ncbi:MAG: F0F1 ATP synthase subunit delta [Propionibacteriaceae bacterium]|nr:F0F1 ATP synthase subunit delta [Propionibacteriaceae bacterium]
MNDAQVALDEAGDALKASLDLAGDVLAVAEAMDAQYQLRRSLSEPNAAPEQMAHLVDTLLGPLVSPSTVFLIRAAVAQSWPSANALAFAVRDEAVRVTWRASISNRTVETTRRQVLSLMQAATVDAGLSTAIGDTSRSLDDRQALVASLVEDAKPAVVLLTRSAVADQRDGFVANLSRYLDCLAQLRGRLRARVTTAVAMTTAQASAMQTQLSRIYGAPIDMEPVVSSGVVGGVRVDVGGDVIDGSIKARLDAAREQLTGVRIEAAQAASEDGRHA